MRTSLRLAILDHSTPAISEGVGELFRGFADHFEVPYNCINGLLVQAELLE